MIENEKQKYSITECDENRTQTFNVKNYYYNPLNIRSMALFFFLPTFSITVNQKNRHSHATFG